MSRSRKKPFGNVCHTHAGEMKDWKRECNQAIRRMPVDEDMPKGKQYKKFSDIWDSPSDGRMCYYGDPPSSRRK